jgi:putative ABC transport system ATP-binding protein
MIKTKNLKKIYLTGEVETTALDNINLDVKEGEYVAIMGPSGCGKSTLLNVVGLLDSPSEGCYHFEGQDISRSSETERANLRKRNIGFVFQSFNLIDELSVYENIELPLLYLGSPPSERRKRVLEIMDQMNLVQRKSHFPHQLSGGQQQRVAVARAVVGKPKLILVDEPTGNLDSKNGEEVMGLLTNLHKEGTTIIMVTHSEDHACYSQRIIHLFDGQIIAENISEHLNAHYSNPK